MTRVNHDAVERNPLLCERERELEVLRVGRMIEMNGYGYRCLVCAAETRLNTCFEFVNVANARIEAELEKGTLPVRESDGEQLKNGRASAALGCAHEAYHRVRVVAGYSGPYWVARGRAEAHQHCERTPYPSFSALARIWMVRFEANTVAIERDYQSSPLMCNHRH